MKRIKAMFLILNLLLNMLSGLCVRAEDVNEVIYNEDFQGIAIGEKPQNLSFTYGEVGGKISTVELNGEKCLFVSNNSDGLYSFFRADLPKQDKSLYFFEFKYMQKDVVSTKSVLFDCKDNEKNIFSIISKNKKVYFSSMNKNDSLMEEFYPNVWYSFSLTVDTVLSKCTISINGENAGTFDIENVDDYLTEVSSYTGYSPGFYLDNLCAKTSQSPDSIVITGKDSACIPPSGERTYTYEANVYDSKGNIIDVNIVFEVTGTDENVTYTQEGNKLTLSVKDSCAEKSIDINVTYASTTQTKTVLIRKEQILSAEIVGDNKLVYNENTSNEFQYKGAFYNQNNEETSYENVTWELTGTTENLLLDSETGLITVIGDLKKDTWASLLLRDISTGDVLAQKNIALLDIYTYRKDRHRFDTVLSSVDKIFKNSADKYRGTPLLADGINVRTNQHMTMDYVTDAKNLYDTTVYSNLAFQSNFMRALYNISAVTGNNEYKNKVKEINQYFAENYFNTTSNLLQFAGHMYVDLYTGDVIEAKGNKSTHELKDTYYFIDPLYETNPDIATKYLKGIFSTHFFDTSILLANRHGDTTDPYDDNKYENIDAFDKKGSTGLTPSTNLPFRTSGNDFIDVLTTLYENTGDEKALTWADRILYRYTNPADPQTNIRIDVYTTGVGAPGLGYLPPKWWELPNYEDYTGSGYGDRAYNQFADTLVEDGVIDESQRYSVSDATLIMWNIDAIYGYGPLVEIRLAEAFGKANKPEKRKEIITECVQSLAAYLRCAYIPESNKFKAILSNGTSLDGYIIKRNGYYGKSGTVIRPSSVNESVPYAASMLLSYQDEFPEYQEDYETILSFLNNYMTAVGIGQFGKDKLGDKVVINGSHTSNNPVLLMLTCECYKATGNTAFLDLARSIGNNIVENKIYNGYFVDSKNTVYTSINNKYLYALTILDAAISNDFDNIPRITLCDPYYQSYVKDERGRDKRYKDTEYYWPQTFKSVYTTAIIPETDTIVLKPGEKHQLSFTIKPADASSQTVYWYPQDDEILTVGNNNDILALKTGETVLIGKSSDLRAETKIQIVVSEEE